VYFGFYNKNSILMTFYILFCCLCFGVVYHSVAFVYISVVLCE
mgnify:CR=1